MVANDQGRRDHAGVDGSPAGVQATATLTDLMKGKTVTCEDHGIQDIARSRAGQVFARALGFEAARRIANVRDGSVASV